MSRSFIVGVCCAAVAIMIVVAFWPQARRVGSSSGSAPEALAADQVFGGAARGTQQPGDAAERVLANQENPRLEGLLRGEIDPLRPEAVEAYLAANNRNAASLMAALRVTGDDRFLQEAVTNFPKDPRVAFESWARERNPAEREKWLEVMKASDPENALAFYLAAANRMKLGAREEALREVELASTKGGYSYFARENSLEVEEVYRTAGYTEPEAKIAATWSLPLPHLAEVKQLAIALREMRAEYLAAGDTAAAKNVTELAFAMGERLVPNPSFTIENLVGISVQQIMLNGLDPAEPSIIPERSNGDVIAQLKEIKERLRAASAGQEELYRAASPQDLAIFTERARALGELQAVEWLRARYGSPPP